MTRPRWLLASAVGRGHVTLSTRPLRGDTRWQDWSAGVERTRQVAAELIGGQATEIALVPNTTHAISLVAEGFPWRPGDSVVVPDNEFPSNLLPWRNLARRGVQLRLVPTPSDGTIEPEDIVSQIDDSTRLVALSWVGFASGYRCDIEAIAERVHDRGCLLLVDAIQGLGAFPLDVRTCSIDFLAADGHKWLLGPEGAGILYIHQPHLELLQPLNVGRNSLAGGSFEPESVDLKSPAARYEGGSRRRVGMLGPGASLQMLMEYGCPLATSPLATAIQENVQRLEEMLTGAGFDVDLPGDPATKRHPRGSVAGSRCGRSRSVPAGAKVSPRATGGRQRAGTTLAGSHARLQ